MNTKKRSGFLACAISFVLCLVMLLQVPVGAAEAYHLNYGSGAASDVTLSASRLFLAIEDLKGKLTQAELDALDALAEASISYSKVPSSVISSEYDGNAEKLTVSVSSYTYKAKNGKTVTWVPKSVRFVGTKTETKTLTEKNGRYSCVFTGLSQSQSYTLDVDFEWQVELETELVNLLLTRPYSAAKAAYEQMLYAEYPDQKKAYDEYVEAKADYDAKKKVYDEYTALKAQYDADLKAYEENEAKKKAYAEAEAKYYAYQKEREKNAALYDQYETYLKKIEKVDLALAVLDSAYITVSKSETVAVGWNYYRALKGTTATAFLDKLDKTAGNVGYIDPALIKKARDASQQVKELLVAYNEVRSAKYSSKFAKKIAKFAYYKEHYVELCNAMKSFYENMNAIYCTTGIPEATKGEGKTTQMELMISQSYVIYTALNDSVTMDSNWKLLSKNLSQVLYPEYHLTDTNNVNPATIVIPEKEVVLPKDLPDPAPHPGEPNFDPDLTKPVLNWTGSVPKNPGSAPAVVKNPGDVRPAKPSSCPLDPMTTKVGRSLAEAFGAGKIKPQSAVTGSRTATLRQTVSCKRGFKNEKEIVFCDFYGNPIGEPILADRGDSMSLYRSLFPDYINQEGDHRYSKFEFNGYWVDSGSGKPVFYEDLSSIKILTDLKITPDYTTTDRWYVVVWEADGQKRVEQEYKYGEKLQCPFDEASLSYVNGTVPYEFAGWSPTWTPNATVTENVTYKAVYEKPEYKVTWVVGNQRITTTVKHGELADDSAIVKAIPAANGYAYQFTGWNNSIVPAQGDAEYVACFSKTVLAKNDDGSVCGAEQTEYALILTPADSTVWLKAAMQYAAQRDLDLQVTWGDYSVVFSAEQVRRLSEKACAGMRLNKTAMENRQNAFYYEIEFLNQMGRTVVWSEAVAVKIHSTANSIMAYVEKDGTLTEVNSERYVGYVLFEANAADRICYWAEYRLSYSDPTQNSNLQALPGQAAAGDVVDLQVNCGYGYEVVGAILKYADGRTEVLNGTRFVMPSEAVSAELKVDKIAFLVTFVADGTVYREITLFFGDKLVLPEPPTKTEDESHTYAFAGWSPEVWGSAVYLENRNPVFEAVFTAYEKSDAATERHQLMFLIRLVLIVLGVAAIVLCIVFRRRLARVIRRITKKEIPAPTDAETVEAMSIDASGDQSETIENPSATDNDAQD